MVETYGSFPVSEGHDLAGIGVEWAVSLDCQRVNPCYNKYEQNRCGVCLVQAAERGSSSRVLPGATSGAAGCCSTRELSVS